MKKLSTFVGKKVDKAKEEIKKRTKSRPKKQTKKESEMDDDEFAAKEAEKFKDEKSKSLVMWIDKLESMREILIHMDDQGKFSMNIDEAFLSVNGQFTTLLILLFVFVPLDAMEQLDEFEKDLNELRE